MVNAILAHVNNYISLTQEEEEFFTSLLTTVEINKKTWLVRPGARIEHEYFVVNGCLKAYYLDESGDKHIIQFAIENWWVGDFDAFYNKVDSRLYIEALEDSTLLAISYDDLQQLFERVPKFERYFRLLVTNAFISLRGRVLSSLEKTLKERYLEFCRVYPNIEKRVANYHIANYLGASPESLSRIRRKLVKTA
ncbi:Crp/Fnr family transcriptional regulator [Zeaxanthinibacter enoshimensis]|uniref:CRP-like cAMP-binding protein n=1 Tax=Zeaxanthinibacter enoshimensis TaxID=392009 RepID=A0A4R6TRJ4_9FLAO|nr:Crp/Fnr family transcriptional regulator [Zeaxanthinibacter enoshimensis]TDQ31110.1 CRP-like cAMP-binding protein [Zeaxanthinibacter enoshimensis]